MENKVLNPDGTYKFKWSYHGCEPKNSTCFPAYWSKEKIIKKINEATKNIITDELKSSGRLQITGQTMEGIEIKMILQFEKIGTQNTCKVISCYPIFKKGMQ